MHPTAASAWRRARLDLSAAAEPIQNGMVPNMFEHWRGTAYGLLRCLPVLLGLILTPALGQPANTQNGRRIGLFVMGGISLLSGLLIALLVHEPPRREVVGDPKAGKLQIGRFGSFLMAPTVWLLMFQFVFLPSTVLFAFLVTYLVQVRGWAVAEAAILYTVFMAGLGISYLFGGLPATCLKKGSGPRAA